MGFNVALLAYTGPTLRLDLSMPDTRHDQPESFMRRLFPRTEYISHGSLTLEEGGFPLRGQVNIGSFEAGILIATRDAYLFNPRKLHRRYLGLASNRAVVLITQQSFYDMFAYARWVDGTLVRSISVNPVGKVWEDVGDPEPFEVPFWRGERRVDDDDYPLPFHPLDLGDAALRSVLGLHYEGGPSPGLVSPADVTLHAYRRADL
jgi:hypothetical protein